MQFSTDLESSQDISLSGKSVKQYIEYFTICAKTWD